MMMKENKKKINLFLLSVCKRYDDQVKKERKRLMVGWNNICLPGPTSEQNAKDIKLHFLSECWCVYGSQNKN
jgi:hypothetical protein